MVSQCTRLQYGKGGTIDGVACSGICPVKGYDKADMCDTLNGRFLVGLSQVGAQDR